MSQVFGLIETNRIQVEVVIRLGKVVLTVEDLSLLRPGELINLDHEMSDGVDICVAEQIVAKGELAMVGGDAGRVCIRIVESVCKY